MPRAGARLVAWADAWSRPEAGQAGRRGWPAWMLLAGLCGRDTDPQRGGLAPLHRQPHAMASPGAAWPLALTKQLLGSKARASNNPQGRPPALGTQGNRAKQPSRQEGTVPLQPGNARAGAPEPSPPQAPLQRGRLPQDSPPHAPGVPPSPAPAPRRPRDTRRANAMRCACGPFASKG